MRSPIALEERRVLGHELRQKREEIVHRTGRHGRLPYGIRQARMASDWRRRPAPSSDRFAVAREPDVLVDGARLGVAARVWPR